jgi:pimeloyl-ACP methyl ester carboxylesterase
MTVAFPDSAAEPTAHGSFVREPTRFECGGAMCDAWVYRPGGVTTARPVIVMAHGLGAVKEMLAAYAERFATAGYVCLVFDYRCFGGSEGEPRQRLSVHDQLGDWNAAIAHARRLPGVDPDMIVIWGTSFAGGHVLKVAAGDPRFTAVIAQCPFTDGLVSSLAVGPVSAAKVTAAAVRDLVGGWRGKEPGYLPVSGAPGTAAFLTSPDAPSGMTSITAGAERYENRLTARSAFDVLRYAPGRSASGITCPLFIALCERDTMTPAKAARRQLVRAPRAEIRMYPIGHFDIYLGDWFERAVADHLRFLQCHVPL